MDKGKAFRESATRVWSNDKGDIRRTWWRQASTRSRRMRSACSARRFIALSVIIFVAAIVVVSTFVQSALLPMAIDMIDGVDLVAPAEVFGGACVLLIGMGGLAEFRARTSSGSSSAWQQVERLEHLMVLKADFTAMVAHELGSPIAAVRGFSELLAGGRLAPEEQIQAIHALRNQADDLDHLVRDLALAARVEQADFGVKLQAVAVRSIMRQAAEFARTIPGEHPVICIVDEDARVLADPVRIRQVMRNLIANAAKFSADRTPIELRATHVDRQIRVEVIDMGCGIDSADFVRIFTKFGRGSAGGRRSAGLGLGLYLSRRIIAAHGAELTVQSTPGVGSIFGYSLEIVT